MKKKQETAAVKFVRVTESVHGQLLKIASKLQEKNGVKTDLGDAVAYAAGAAIQQLEE